MNFLKKLFLFNSSRHHLWQENENFAQQIPTGAIVLDAGAGTAPYKSLFSHTQYETADFEKVEKDYLPSTYVCDLTNIPVEDNRFDYIIFNQVMEHLPEPKQVLIELSRVLKPGGKMIYSGPLFFEEHEEPYDFYRYTQYGLNHLFTSAGFAIEKIDWLEGYFGTVGYQLNRMARYLPIKPSQLGGGVTSFFLSLMMIALRLLFGVCSIVFHRLEIRIKFTDKGYPKNYIAIVVSI